DAAGDLQLAEVVRVLVSGAGRPTRRDQRERVVRQALGELCMDAGVLAYRQDVVDDLLADQQLRERLGQVLSDLEGLTETGPASRFQVADDGTVQKIARQL